MKKYCFLASIIVLAAVGFISKSELKTQDTATLPSINETGLKEAVEKLDPKKPTVCTITINSDDEREIFKDHLEKDFNHIELVDRNDHDWFLNSCRSGLKCDVLVLSGHFGGSFFGKSGAKLSLAELENNSCSSVCDGIIKKPKEVFLFGCNTTAGKEKDSRTPEEYARVLVEDGFNRRQAEMVAAFRYSDIGTDTKDRMRRVFKHSKIYGFHSIAPSGVNVSRSLKKYFKSFKGKPYLKHINNILGKKNHRWDSALKQMAIRTVEGSSEIENPVCALKAEGSIGSILSWVNEAISDENKVLSYLPNINQYLDTLITKLGPVEIWPKTEREYIEKIQFNKKAKSQVFDLLKKPVPGAVSAQIDVLNFSRTVGWVNDVEYKSTVMLLIGDIFKTNLDFEMSDLICSMNVKLDLGLEQLPPQPWSPYTITSLGCIKNNNTQALLTLIDYLEGRKDSGWSDSWATNPAGAALKEIPIKDKESFSKILDMLETEHRFYAEEILPFHIKGNAVFQDMMFNGLLKSSVEKQISVARALSSAQIIDEKNLESLSELLLSKNKNLKTSVTYALSVSPSENKTVHSRLIGALDSMDDGVRANAAMALGHSKVDSRFVQEKLVQIFQSTTHADDSNSSIMAVFRDDIVLDMDLRHKIKKQISEDYGTMTFLD